MAKELIIKFRNAEETHRCDLTRLGIVAGQSEDGLVVIVEPDFGGWAGTSEALESKALRDVIESSMAACGVWVEVMTRSEYTESTNSEG